MSTTFRRLGKPSEEIRELNMCTRENAVTPWGQPMEYYNVTRKNYRIVSFIVQVFLWRKSVDICENTWDLFPGFHDISTVFAESLPSTVQSWAFDPPLLLGSALRKVRVNAKYRKNRHANFKEMPTFCSWHFRAMTLLRVAARFLLIYLSLTGIDSANVVSYSTRW